MAERSGESGKLKRLGPFGAGVVFLILDFPPAPSVLFALGKAQFYGLKAVALLAGILVGFNFTRNFRNLQSKVRSALAVALLALVIMGLTIGYFSLVPDAENRLLATRILFFALVASIGILLALVSPALVWIANRLNPKDK